MWSDPSAYYWTILAYDLVGACLSARPLGFLARVYAGEVEKDDARATLAVTLGDFKRFVLASALLASREERFETPFVARLPVAIPATRFVLLGDGTDEEVAIHGATADALDVTHRGMRRSVPLDGESDPPLLRVERSPLATCNGYELPLEPAAFQLFGLPFAATLRALPRSYQSESAPLVAAALDMIARHDPGSFAQLAAAVRLAAAKPSAAGDFTNSSHSALPGAFVVSIVTDPYVLAGAIVHELHHNRLFAVEEWGAFIDGDAQNAVGPDEYYSPWRDDIRPIVGIFHGLYVYVAVARFWLDVYRHDDLDGERRRLVEDRLIRVPLQLALAATQLERHARLTTFGASLFDVMRDDVTRLCDDVAALGAPEDPPAIILTRDGTLAPETRDGRALRVRAAVTEHRIRFA